MGITAGYEPRGVADAGRITLDESGTYRWKGTVDVSYEHKTYRIVFGVCGGICGAYLILSWLMAREYFGLILLISLVVAAVCGGVCFLFELNAGRRRQAYLMTEDCITFGSGKTANPFFFKSIKKAVIHTNRNMIELYTPVGSGPVFVPHADFGLVRDHILHRLPETAEVDFQ